MDHLVFVKVGQAFEDAPEDSGDCLDVFDSRLEAREDDVQYRAGLHQLASKVEQVLVRESDCVVQEILVVDRHEVVELFLLSCGYHDFL